MYRGLLKILTHSTTVKGHTLERLTNRNLCSRLLGYYQDDIWVSYGGVAEDVILLGCDAVSNGN